MFKIPVILEIFMNPDNLEILITQDEISSKFGIGIFRGPGYNSKPLLTSRPDSETHEEAVGHVRGTLQMIHHFLTTGYENNKNLSKFISEYTNPARQEIDQSKILNLDLIERIVKELRQNGVARTYTIPILEG